ncbi:60S ribosomal protein L24-like [Sesamum indicum]|uniref:60S ribosomal protein L24-like n=1 Tax=Sesamum indicum TaxID=4182 RepID=A0A6I9TE17_SESIN|nr:60S ribosomal protein L24-like [Sesamum indicum]
MGLKTLGEKFQQGYCVVSLETAVYIRRGFRVSSTAEKKKEAATSDRFTTMVLKTELCRFSGAKIYPGKGIRFIRSDSQVFLFANSKCKRYFHNRLRPAKLTWTAMYRKQHKKDIAAEAVKKRRRTTKKPYSRSIVGATLEVIQKRRAEKPEVRDAAREAALREIKERIKKTKDEKKAKKAETMSKQKTSKGSQPKGAMPKGPKIGGGGGKR